jgi:hypothetical protein
MVRDHQVIAGYMPWKASGEARIVTARQDYLFGNREEDAVISELQFLKDDDSDLPTLNLHVD